jgi:hypothetical protein
MVQARELSIPADAARTSSPKAYRDFAPVQDMAGTVANNTPTVRRGRMLKSTLATCAALGAVAHANLVAARQKPASRNQSAKPDYLMRKGLTAWVAITALVAGATTTSAFAASTQPKCDNADVVLIDVPDETSDACVALGEVRLRRSILQHEITHAVIAQLLGKRYDRLPHAWHEALAYAVQIDLMDDDLRAKAVTAYPEEKPFEMTTHINDIIYGFDPDAFAIRAYLTYARDGRVSFMRKALALEFEMVDVSELN